MITSKQLTWAPDKKSAPILSGISYQCLPNKVNAIVGPNGSGKTTFLRCLYNRLQPNSGEVYCNEQSLKCYDSKVLAKHIAVVTQEYPTEFHLSVEDILYLGFLPHLSLSHISAESKQQQVKQMALQLEIEHLLHRYFDNLSGGEKQRVMIARALLQQPEVLILDEPTNHLDIHHQLSLLRWLKEANLTVICSLHDLNLAARFCDSIAIMQQGKLIAQGHPESVITESILKAVFSIDTSIKKSKENQSISIELL